MEKYNKDDFIIAKENFHDLENEYAHTISDILDEQRKNELNNVLDINKSCLSFNDYVLTGSEQEKLLSEHWNDPNVMKTLSCYTDKMTLSPGSRYEDRLTGLHNYIKKLSLLNKGANGNAFNTSINDHVYEMTDKVFVIKTPLFLTDETYNEQLHEYATGVIAINNIRSLIPNFVYTLGSFACSPPYLNVVDNVKSFCQNEDNNTLYLVIEKIPGRTWHRFVRSASHKDIINCLSQLFLALAVAYEKYEYNHNDLHTNNIIVRELKEEVKIKYTINDKDYFVTSKYIPTIIDLGRSTFKYKGDYYGMDGISLGAIPFITNPVNDSIKLLIETAADLNNKKFNNILKELIDGDIIDFLNFGSHYYFQLPHNKNTDVNFITDFWINFVNLTEDSDAPIWSCRECLDKESILNLYFEDYDEFYEDVYTFYSFRVKTLSEAEINEKAIEYIDLHISTLYEDYMKRYKDIKIPKYANLRHVKNKTNYILFLDALVLNVVRISDMYRIKFVSNSILDRWASHATGDSLNYINEMYSTYNRLDELRLVILDLLNKVKDDSNRYISKYDDIENRLDVIHKLEL